MQNSNLEKKPTIASSEEALERAGEATERAIQEASSVYQAFEDSCRDVLDNPDKYDPEIVEITQARLEEARAERDKVIVALKKKTFDGYMALAKGLVSGPAWHDDLDEDVSRNGDGEYELIEHGE